MSALARTNRPHGPVSAPTSATWEPPADHRRTHQSADQGPSDAAGGGRASDDGLAGRRSDQREGPLGDAGHDRLTESNPHGLPVGGGSSVSAFGRVARWPLPVGSRVEHPASETVEAGIHCVRAPLHLCNRWALFALPVRREPGGTVGKGHSGGPCRLDVSVGRCRGSGCARGVSGVASPHADVGSDAGGGRRSAARRRADAACAVAVDAGDHDRRTTGAGVALARADGHRAGRLLHPRPG
jgi:hypothetical protein